MTQRRMHFEHDGHRFDADEERTGGAGGGQEHVRWVVRMNGVTRLEFEGAFPYRDEDVRKRVLEWYEIQKPRPAGR